MHIKCMLWFESCLLSQLLSNGYCNCYCLSRKPIFSRICGGVAVPCTKAICGGDGFARDFGRGRHENLSGAISWFTFLAGGAADVRRSRSDWRRELAESTICCLLYTSDAADDLLCVDLGGRRIIQ